MTAGHLIEFPLERRQPRRLIPLKALVAELGMSERWVRYRLAEGMPSYRYGQRLRFDLGEVQAWLEERSHHES